MTDRTYERGQQDGRHRTRGHRRYDVLAQQASPLSGSDAEDERLRQDRLTPPLEGPYFYDAHPVSSGRTDSYTPDYTAYRVDGSIASSPHRNTNGYPRHSERSTPPPPRSMQLDNEYPRSPPNEDETFGTGAWTADPFYGGQPQYTYGHNGLYYNSPQSHRTDALGQPLEQSRLYQQPSGPVSWYSDLRGHSRSDELPSHPRFTERRTAHTDARRGRHDHQERPEYHESHDYDEHRERRRRRAREERYHEPERHYRSRPRGPH